MEFMDMTKHGTVLVTCSQLKKNEVMVRIMAVVLWLEVTENQRGNESKIYSQFTPVSPRYAQFIEQRDYRKVLVNKYIFFWREE
jgi:hypothetical protein